MGSWSHEATNVSKLNSFHFFLCDNTLASLSISVDGELVKSSAHSDRTSETCFELLSDRTKNGHFFSFFFLSMPPNFFSFRRFLPHREGEKVPHSFTFTFFPSFGIRLLCVTSLLSSLPPSELVKRKSFRTERVNADPSIQNMSKFCCQLFHSLPILLSTLPSP